MSELPRKEVPPISLSLPKPIAPARYRQPKQNIPQTPEERTQILHAVRNYVAEYSPTPPVPVAELAEHADRLVQHLGILPIYRDYVGVLINNELWREQLAAVPFERRLLLMPKCLRVESKCPAPFDEFGLLCKQCGLCSIQDLQNEAERLGYAVLVAEGSAIVMSLIQTGQIEAIVGISCLSVLERSFPYMEAAAIPGVAVPLLQDDCIDTTVDLDWVWDYIHLTADDKTRRLDLGSLRGEVDTWFSEASLTAIMGAPADETERIGREWLARAGKRWRPFLAVAAWRALAGTDAAMPEDLKKVAVAVECFHKASLIHDDIEDEDATRYGEPTLHAEHGIAVALNVGDLLIGEGYRLLAAADISAEQRAAMIAVAAAGQRELSRGQGAELLWARKPEPLTSLQVLDIFKKKTAPAFEVALRIGAIFAGIELHDEVADVLRAYSEALGIAYQIHDDIADLGQTEDTSDIAGLRPSLLLAAAHERAECDNRKFTSALWERRLPEAATVAQIEQLYRDLKADERCKELLERYKEEAIRSLRDLENPSLKGLLRRVVGKIFNDTEIKGWCKEFEAKNLLNVTGTDASLEKSEPRVVATV
ncbi:MAG: polyprenyl synthetase family protein [Verrucomicrobia bacterium]|nr:polyprenyl synthetase family protein [Verrucomicrobiota bacterium]